MKKTYALILAIGVCLLLAACDRQAKDNSSVVQGNKASASESTKPKSDLDPTSQDAVDLAITSMAMQQSLNPLTVSATVKERLAKYDAGTEFKRSAKNVLATFVNGCVIHIKDGGEFITTFTGGLNAEISFISGEVGIQDGEIYVREGTGVLVNKEKMIFTNGVWKKQG